MSEQPSGHLIVVGIDGSERSAHALRWALKQAQQTAANVKAVMCWEVPNSIYITPTHTEEYYEQRAEEVLREVMAQVEGDVDGVRLEGHVIGQVPGIALVDAAKGADLLVVDCHNVIDRHGVHLGSVASYAVHHAPCPVLVYREPVTD